MALILRKLTKRDEAAYYAFLRDWVLHQESIIPTAAALGEWGKEAQSLPTSPADFDPTLYSAFLLQKEQEEYSPAPGLVPATLLVLQNEKHQILGALHLRHHLNENLLAVGGHIGYGVAPAFRGSGHAARMVRMAIPMAREMGIDRLLLTCNGDNIPSQKTIVACGGVLENIVPHGAQLYHRYWIDCNKKGDA